VDVATIFKVTIVYGLHGEPVMIVEVPVPSWDTLATPVLVENDEMNGNGADASE